MKTRSRMCSLLSVLALAWLSSSCHDSGSRSAAAPNRGVSGAVTGKGGQAVTGATVYLVPSKQIDRTPINPAGILARTTEAFDEPLEDLVRAAGTTFQRDTTDATGAYEILDVAEGRYFLFVEPASGDAEHLPGGNRCRASYAASELQGMQLDITLSSSPPLGANYVGMTLCLRCHPTYATEETLAHRLGFRVPGVSSPLQDTSEHPEIDDGLAYFLAAADYTGGSPIYFYDYDSTRGFDKFKVSTSDPTPGGVLTAILWAWRDTADMTYKLTIENAGNPGDPSNFAERDVKLTYGGAVYKQRYMIEWPGLNGLYPILQYQTSGSDGIHDRTRKQFRDYHLDFYWNDGGTPSDPSDDLLQAPSVTRNIQRNCMGCHAANYTQFTDMVTGEVLCDTLEDIGGEYDLDGDGFLNDLNTGCENCHGPGSEHVANLGRGGRWLVTPENLTASRSVMICARCHDRQVGNGTIKNDHPLNAMDEFPLPGIGREEYLTEHVTRPGPKASDYWADFEHSKSHHQQGSDFLRSTHYRNSEQLLDCWDCHNMHGGTGFKHGLVADPDVPETELCMGCHREEIGSTILHTQQHLGIAHGSFTAKCVDCHMTKTAKTGAGSYGYQLAPPTGTSADDATAYFENDITSHSFDVPSKFTVGVVGVQPTQAMPVPYTNRCATCHDPSTLPL